MDIDEAWLRLREEHIFNVKSIMEIPREFWKEEQLVSQDEKAEEEKWRKVFQKRRVEMMQTEKKSKERRARSAKKLRDLESRWRQLEDRRIVKFNEYLERASSTLSARTESEQTNANNDR